MLLIMYIINMSIYIHGDSQLSLTISKYNMAAQHYLVFLNISLLGPRFFRKKKQYSSLDMNEK